MERDKLGRSVPVTVPPGRFVQGRSPALSFSSFLLPHELWVPPIPQGATNPSAHALGLSERGGKLRAQAGAGGELHLFPAPRSCCSHFFSLSAVSWQRGQTCTWPPIPRSLQTFEGQHPPESKVSTREQPSLASSCQQHLRPALPVSHLCGSLQPCPDPASSDSRTARVFFFCVLPGNLPLSGWGQLSPTTADSKTLTAACGES